MDETLFETLIGIGARLGIVTAHSFELIGGMHTVTIVVVLWSLEELVAVKVAARRLKRSPSSDAPVHHEHKMLHHLKKFVTRR